MTRRLVLFQKEKPMTPTIEQQNILDSVKTTKSNLMIRARAGCGKTSMLEMIDRAEKSAPYLLMCFNKAIATEAEKRMRSATTVRTFNSLGHKIWAAAVDRRLTLNKKKIAEIFRSLVDEASRGERAYLWSMYDSVLAATSIARNIGYIPAGHARASKSLCDFRAVERLLDETLLPDAHPLIDKIMNLSIARAYNGEIDFTDQVYMPALFGGTYPSFPVVLVDEYQDLSPVNRAMVARLCKHSRQIGVGDEAQAIYEFRGADIRAMPDAIAQFNMATLPLSTSFRCPNAITANVQWHVPDIRSVRSGGIVARGNIQSIEDNSTVICRYNAPLIALAMDLLTQGHKVDVAGVDIGARIIRLLGKLGPEDMTNVQVLQSIEHWEAERESLDNKNARDTAECMRVFARHGKTLGQAIAYAKHIFESSGGTIRFMSGHRAKGLEFDHVYHLNSEDIRPGGQEQNIHYVIDTRPKKQLTYIRSH